MLFTKFFLDVNKVKLSDKQGCNVYDLCSAERERRNDVRKEGFNKQYSNRANSKYCEITILTRVLASFCICK